MAAEGTSHELVIWNVGQGSWATEVLPDLCIHYDLGGEKDPSSQVLHHCRKKENFIFLSHWDWDHVSFAGKYSKLAAKTCLVRRPQGNPSPKKERLFKRIPICSLKKTVSVQKLIRTLFKPWKGKSSNDRSEILFSSSFQVLLPGDSTKAQEKLWKIFAPPGTRGLILGHHGSLTSTSPQLLDHLPKLQWAVSSARRKKYGHPHPKVAELLLRKKIPLLKTEDWGHIHFVKSSSRQLTACRACIPFPGHERQAHNKRIRHTHSVP